MACDTMEPIALPDIRKKILYLDQFFLSHAFREKAQPFVEAVKRIRSLTDQQLLVCPWSTIHEIETHLWRHEDQSKLWEFIKYTARGHKFEDAYSIKSKQFNRSFEAFSASSPFENQIVPTDALPNTIHEWDDYFWIDVVHPTEDMEPTRSNKLRTIQQLVPLFDKWRKYPASFEEDFQSEVNGYGRELARLAVMDLKAMMQILLTGEATNYLSNVLESELVTSLLLRGNIKDTININHMKAQADRVYEFMSSSYFQSIPYIDISCRILAFLHKIVRQGQYKNEQKAIKELSGLIYDIEVVSVFAPYTDAVFLDKTMRRWILEPECAAPQKYNFACFSADTWDEFYRWLDDIETSNTESHSKFLKLAYP